MAVLPNTSIGSFLAGRSGKLLIGTLIVMAAGYVSDSPSVLGLSGLPWPNAALWAAAGWGLTGLGLRPLIILIAIGLCQDVVNEAPFGAHVAANLAAFGASAFLAGRRDGKEGAADATSFAIGVFSILFGFAALLGLAFVVNETAPRITRILGDIGMTVLVFVPVFPVFVLPPDNSHMFSGRGRSA